MKITLFYHSLISDWNHGNAHFLRGMVRELLSRGHQVRVMEPHDSWSLRNLIHDHGTEPIQEFHQGFPELVSESYRAEDLDIEMILRESDLVIVHEWNEPKLVNAIGKQHARNPECVLLFHDTHHRIITDFESMNQFDLRPYDGVLAFGKVIADLYQAKGSCMQTWTWHEAADTRTFRPLSSPTAVERKWDVVWIGNWGDEERSEELHEFLIDPVKELGLSACVHGVRFPPAARRDLAQAGISYRGWLPNYRVPEVFSKARMTVHIPRKPYVEALRGIPTIRVFEALACGIPLISAPWQDSENLFRPGEDFLIANDRKEMKAQMQRLLHEPHLATKVAERGLETIRARHSCSHRADELMNIYEHVRAHRALHEELSSSDKEVRYRWA